MSCQKNNILARADKKHVNLSLWHSYCQAWKVLVRGCASTLSSYFCHVIAHGLELHGGAHQIQLV